jgi:hypothetical protein
MVTVTIRQNDPRLAAIKAGLLHGIPELTGKQINSAAFLALIAIDKLREIENEDSLGKSYPVNNVMSES